MADESTVQISPRFSQIQIEKIDGFIKLGYAKTRADFVYQATLEAIELNNQKSIKEVTA